jgi:hypothetical protein
LGNIKTGPKLKKNSKTNSPEMAQQRADFVRFYIEQDFRDATAAYQRAFNCTPVSARTGAARLLANANIQDALSTELAAVLKEKRRPLEKRVLDTWMVRAFYDPTEILDLEGNLAISGEELRKRGLQVCIDSINKKLNAQGDEYVEYKLADRDKALDMIQKYIQMVKPIDASVKGTDADGNPFAFSVSFVKPEDEHKSNTNK